MGGQAHPQHLRHDSRRAGDAVRGRRRRRAARRAAERRRGDDLHGVAGPDADAAQHVQDRRRADGLGDVCGGALAGHPGAVDLRRPSGRDGGALDRLCHAVGGLGAGGARPGGRGPGGDAEGAHADHPFHGRFPHLARGQQPDAAHRRDAAGDDRRHPGAGAPRTGAQPGAPGGPRHGAQSGYLLPGARDGEPVLCRHRRHRAGGDGQARQALRPPIQAVPL